MADKFSTEDCKNAIKNWYSVGNKDYPGEFKRVKKFKNTDNQWVRIFEHIASNTSLKVIETDNVLIVSAFEQVGKGYIFGFSEDETYGDEVVCFYVAEKSFFEENGYIESVHFGNKSSLPDHFEEVMESCFNVWNKTEGEVRKELLELGFTESKELTDLNSD